MAFLKEYTLLGELGTGGFAKVYKVRHNELDYIRAIRVLNETVIDENSKTYRKFIHECKVLLRLGNGSHCSIVHIYQPRLLENHALVEMDYVDGKDIAHYLEENGNFVPAQEVINMVLEISSALAYCHEDIYRFCMDRDVDNLQDDPIDGSKVLIDEPTRQRLIDKYKVIHNDIHSGNIMRREDGSFILLDFGLAITGDDDVRNSSRHDNGAVEFKPPEKWDDDALLTEQSDIYSFGILMYEYLAGRVPFVYDKSKSSFSALNNLRKAHLEQQPPSIFDLRKSFYEAKYENSEYVKDYPEWLENVILKCLSKDPQKRFRNGKELYEFVRSNVGMGINDNVEVESLRNENSQLKAKLEKMSNDSGSDEYLTVLPEVDVIQGEDLYIIEDENNNLKVKCDELLKEKNNYKEQYECLQAEKVQQNNRLGKLEAKAKRMRIVAVLFVCVSIILGVALWFSMSSGSKTQEKSATTEQSEQKKEFSCLQKDRWVKSEMEKVPELKGLYDAIATTDREKIYEYKNVIDEDKHLKWKNLIKVLDETNPKVVKLNKNKSSFSVDDYIKLLKVKK